MARPRRPPPPPLETNDVRVSAVGAAAWAVALVVLLLIGLSEDDRWWLWVCVTGIAIGLFGIVYIPRLQRSRTALIASHKTTTTETDDPARTGEPAPSQPRQADQTDQANHGETLAPAGTDAPTPVGNTPVPEKNEAPVPENSAIPIPENSATPIPEERDAPVPEWTGQPSASPTERRPHDAHPADDSVKDPDRDPDPRRA
jgi:hypothetical protein